MRTRQGVRIYIIREVVELALLVAAFAVLSQFFPIPVWVFIGVVFAKILVSLSMYVFFFRKVFLRPISVGPEKLVGQIAETITPLNPSGQVKLNGEIWTALSQTETMIPAQQKVEILEVRGTTVHVSPVE
ncbi:MAG TPA: NfeD family protein [Candidatus Heimdallarchaeota archaeon]|nr:NfeD family protein [Candidatus Heimdallarchaeota archaeon]